jgi:hypothetical protein
MSRDLIFQYFNVEYVSLSQIQKNVNTTNKMLSLVFYRMIKAAIIEEKAG